ncbi:hypothetical protein GCM10023149_27850 [Mucilaginibacter gynuensis]|uniref:Pentapeptide MXKDX repeat protein n=1 Tax=Mucilaginibacter gynuensis TaxID=1302236 RepID=A0ABP8GJZ5_9SPHI
MKTNQSVKISKSILLTVVAAFVITIGSVLNVQASTIVPIKGGHITAASDTGKTKKKADKVKAKKKGKMDKMGSDKMGDDKMGKDTGKM